MKKVNTLLTLILALTFTQAIAQGGRYLEEVFDEVTVTRDLVYGVNATVLFLPVVGQAIPQPLVFDFYEPAGDDATERPLVIYLHTGNFLPIQINNSNQGSRTDSSSVEVATRLAKMGYAVAMIDYRLGWNPEAETQPERALGLIQAAYRGIQDTRTAVRFFKHDHENDNVFRIDPERITMWGQGTGGYISLGVATFDEFLEVATTQYPPGKFLTDLDGDPSTLEPMVIPQVHGDIYGTSWGITPPTGFGPFPPNDTLNYINWPGYDSDFQLCVNMGGALADLSWLEEGDVPMISFHSPTDPFAFYETGILIVPTTDDPIVEVQGSKLVIEKANQLGNNDVFANIDVNFPDFAAYTQAATDASSIAGHDYYEGLYPFNIPINEYGNGEGDPWTWWNPEIWDAIPHPQGGTFHTDGLENNANMSPERARMYIDTIVGYFTPRAYVALDLEATSTEDLVAAENVGLQLSPNPASDVIYLQTRVESPMLDVQLFDLNGQLVQSNTNVQNSYFAIHRGALSPGMYVVKMRFKEGVLSKKVVFR